MTEQANFLVARACSIGLDMVLHRPTPTDGNCFYHAILEQIHRPNVYFTLPKEKRFEDIGKLRIAVIEFLRDLTPETAFYQYYCEQNQNRFSGPQWEMYLANQEKNETKADFLIRVAAAFFLDVNILITSQSSTQNIPYFELHPGASSGIQMFLSSSDYNLFQSLVPSTEESVLPFDVENSLQISNSKMTRVPSPKERIAKRAYYMVAQARFIGLDVSHHSPTPGDGNCFFHAIVEQIHRGAVYEGLPEDRRYTDIGELRKAVVKFLKDMQPDTDFYHIVQNFGLQNVIMQNQINLGGDQWEIFLANQEKNAVYAEYILCLATAYYLDVNICITCETSTQDRPYFDLNPAASSGIEMFLASSNNDHFQSLVPTNDIILHFEGSNCLQPIFFFDDCDEMEMDFSISARGKHSSGSDSKQRRYKHHHISHSKSRLAEKKLLQQCQDNNVPYVQPANNETDEQTKSRTKKIKNKIKYQRRKIKQQKQDDLADFNNLQQCRKDNVADNIDVPIENSQEDPLQPDIPIIEDQNPPIPMDVDINPVPGNDAVQPDGHVFDSLHPNPEVGQSVIDFLEGENNHGVATCVVCRETRPVYNPSYNNAQARVKIKVWKVNKAGICDRCRKDRTKRTSESNRINKRNNSSNKGKEKQASLKKPAKFSGHLTTDDKDLGPSSDRIRHNGMHFLPTPPFLQHLTMVERLMIAKITVCTNIHLLRYGMLSSKGHSVSIPNKMSIAKHLPLLPEEIGVIILKRKNQNITSKQYGVRRHKVEQALNGLCFGYPNGGYEDEQPETQKYDGPNCMGVQLNGRYFQYFPNSYYADTVIHQDRMNQLPDEAAQLPGLKVVETQEDMTEDEKGPAPNQFFIPFNEGDDSVTGSGITCPVDPQDADKELKMIIQKMTGSEEILHQGGVASADWDRTREVPIKELKTPGFFTMVAPDIFVNGSCDITCKKLVTVHLDEWIQHIYFVGEDRVPKHPFLKFLLHNLKLRQQALDHGSFLVAQQLNDAHLTIDELRTNLNENNDQSVPLKIIKMGGNLVNTHPYWVERKKELEAFMHYRRKEFGDLPAYFHTNSMAEFHWTSLALILSRYKAQSCGINQQDYYDRLSTDSRFFRHTVLENQHIVTSYFSARTINYYNTVISKLLQTNSFWFRFEFAKGRGQIHSHGVIFSEKHAKEVEESLDCGEEQRARELHEWLQTVSKNSDGVFSPMFTSLHPAGGSEVLTENEDLEWNPNKEGWAPPEGTRDPPDYDPLAVPALETCTNEDDLNEFHIDLANMVALHSCNGYCLKKKKKESKTRYCRSHFGKEDPITKKTPGKELHPFEPRIVSGGHPRYEGPRDHPRMLNHIKTLLISWQANCDCQALIDQDLLNLVKYICSYCCKGACSTEDFVTIYRELLDSAEIGTTVKNVTHRLLMQIVGIVDVPSAAADFINAGGQLYHSTNKIQRVGLSGYRQLNSKGPKNDENATNETPLDQFLGESRRQEDPDRTLYDNTKICRCKPPCGRDHVPLFTGTDVKPIWPLSEKFCKGQLMIHSKGTWRTPDDLKDEEEQFSDAFADFLNDSPDCPEFLKEIVALSKQNYDKKVERDRRRNRNVNQDEIQENRDVQLSQPPSIQLSQDSQQSSQDSVYNDLRLGEALLRDIRLNNNVNFDAIIGEANLFDGGPGFDWNLYGKECFDSNEWPADTKTWLKDKYDEAEDMINTHLNNHDLPDVNLLWANPKQRLIIAINLEKLLDVAIGEEETEPLRLLVQGFGGTGKSFTINAITYIARRLFRRNGSALNIAPTGAASTLIPDGRTLHSTTPIPFMTRNERSTVNMIDHTMNSKKLKKLQTVINFNKETKSHGLYALNMDERSMYSPRLLAWCNQRFMEATEDFNHDFGNIPVVNFFGDLGQLGPIEGKDLHIHPSKNVTPENLKGHGIYKNFTQCVVLTQTMRQKPDQKTLLERLMRIRSGNITQQDWLDINAKYEKNMTEEQKADFQNGRVITLNETWQEVFDENREKLTELGVPIATIPCTEGRGTCHKTTGQKQMGQIPGISYLAVGCPVMLTKNQGPLTTFGLNNGAIGTVIAILYAEGHRPPSTPDAVIVNFEGYKGPAWLDDHPKWVPIVPLKTLCDAHNSCTRTGLPLIAAYSIPIAKSQGMTIGEGKPATHMRVKLQQKNFMEALSLGTTYTALSRVETDSRWCLVEEIPQDRLLYINTHPAMPGRREEEERLNTMSDETIAQYSHYMEDIDSYINLLNRFDSVCNDGIISTDCRRNNDSCPCLLCKSTHRQ